MPPWPLIIRIFVLMFIVRLVAQRSAAQPLHNHQTTRIVDFASSPFGVLQLPQRVSTSNAGSGNFLAAAEIALQAAGKDSRQSPLPWLKFLLKEQNQQQPTPPPQPPPESQTQQPEPQPNRQNQQSYLHFDNFAVPGKRNSAEYFQTNGIDDNSYPSIDDKAMPTGSGYGNSNENENENANENENYAATDVVLNENWDIATDCKAIENILTVADLARCVTKRNPTSVDNFRQYKWNDSAQLHYPYAVFFRDLDADMDSLEKRANWRHHKRLKTRTVKPAFLPSISPGAMTHLGNFFRDLSKNVHFTEKSQLGKAEENLLEGDHPLRLLHEQISGDQPHEAKTADFLHAIRNYRPSQKIRSLVSMNPQGYHGSQFMDPNYMWVGLGK